MCLCIQENKGRDKTNTYFQECSANQNFLDCVAVEEYKLEHK